MFDEGFATREDIDAGGARSGSDHPMGPLTLLDLIGLDTAMHVSNVLYDEFKDPIYAAPTLLKRMVAAGHLGRKSGRGFYDYDEAVRSDAARDRPARAPAHRRVARAVASGRSSPPTEALLPGEGRPRKTIEEVAEEYASRDILGVVLDWDDETVTGRGWMGNDWLAALSERFPGVLMGFGSVDPHKPDAVDEVDAVRVDLGLKGLKFHPTMQAFDPGGRGASTRSGSAAEEHGLIALFHTGTCGIGAGTPGAGGTKIRYSHPGFLDAVGADFPGLTLIAAHFGWPWFMECLALALHKSNVYIELSGWAPGYLPPEVKREIGRRLNAPDAVRQRLPVHPARPVVRRVRRAGAGRGREAGDPARQRGAAAGAGG